LDIVAFLNTAKTVIRTEQIRRQTMHREVSTQKLVTSKKKEVMDMEKQQQIIKKKSFIYI